MFADSRTYPAMTVRGMYKQEQELARSDEAGLILTAADLGYDNTTCVSCNNCGELCPWEVINNNGRCQDCE